MCGVFGFIGIKNHTPDIERLKRIAEQTERRGQHAFGLAWVQDEDIHVFKRPGAASDDLGDLDRSAEATAVIGHCRYATHGDPCHNRNNHPHPAGQGWLVHNGVVPGYRELAARYRLNTTTECDSEVLGLLLARFAGSFARRAAAIVPLVGSRLAMLGLWRNPTRLLIARAGNPLWCGKAREGWYFASLPEDLPGKVREVADYYVGVLAVGPAGLEHNAEVVVDR